MIYNHIMKENYNLSYEEARERARLIFKELNKINNKLHKNNKKYFIHNLPLSIFENEDDGEINYLMLEN